MTRLITPVRRARAPKVTSATTIAVLALTAAACSPTPDAEPPPPVRQTGTPVAVRDSVVETRFEAAAVAEPLQQATLSSKLMGTVMAVLVQEGDRVRAGQPLVRLDARDVEARSAQVAAGIRQADAMRAEAQQQAVRIRGLYGDSAATRQQLEQVESALARAEAGAAQARASAAEVGALKDYAVVRAPFDGIVAERFVDPGAFAAPGAPLIRVLQGTRLRLTATVTPTLAARVRRGQWLDATIEGASVRARVEGVVPASHGALATINATVENATGAQLPGSAATLSIPTGTVRARLVPRAALVHQGDLTGVQLRTARGDLLRWVRLGRDVGRDVVIEAGLSATDTLVLTPLTSASHAATKE